MESYKSGEINRKRNQARSQVVLRGGAIQRGDGPNEVGGGQVSGGGAHPSHLPSLPPWERIISRGGQTL